MKLFMNGAQTPLVDVRIDLSRCNIRMPEHFLDSAQAGTLFAEPWFAQMYTAQAKENLSRELAALN